jgi:hypothetical protein
MKLVLKTTEEEESKYAKDGIFLRTSLLIWDMLRKKVTLWIESTMTEITARKIASGPIGRSNTEISVILDTSLRSENRNRFTLGRVNMDAMPGRFTIGSIEGAFR